MGEGDLCFLRRGGKMTKAKDVYCNVYMKGYGSATNHSMHATVFATQDAMWEYNSQMLNFKCLKTMCDTDSLRRTHPIRKHLSTHMPSAQPVRHRKSQGSRGPTHQFHPHTTPPFLERLGYTNTERLPVAGRSKTKAI